MANCTNGVEYCYGSGVSYYLKRGRGEKEYDKVVADMRKCYTCEISICTRHREEE